MLLCKHCYYIDFVLTFKSWESKHMVLFWVADFTFYSFLCLHSIFPGKENTVNRFTAKKVRSKALLSSCIFSKLDLLIIIWHFKTWIFRREGNSIFQVTKCFTVVWQFWNKYNDYLLNLSINAHSLLKSLYLLNISLIIIILYTVDIILLSV